MIRSLTLSDIKTLGEIQRPAKLHLICPFLYFSFCLS